MLENIFDDTGEVNGNIHVVLSSEKAQKTPGLTYRIHFR